MRDPRDSDKLRYAGSGWNNQRVYFILIGVQEYFHRIIPITVLESVIRSSRNYVLCYDNLLLNNFL